MPRKPCCHGDCGRTSSLRMLIPQLHHIQLFTVETQVPQEPSETFIYARKGRWIQEKSPIQTNLRLLSRDQSAHPGAGAATSCFLSIASALTRDDRTELMLGDVQTCHMITARFNLRLLAPSFLELKQNPSYRTARRPVWRRFEEVSQLWFGTSNVLILAYKHQRAD